MQVGAVFNISGEAMMERIRRMDEIAHNVAKFDTVDEQPGQEEVNLINEFTDMTMNQRAFEADAAVIRTADDMLEEILGLL